MGDVFHGVTDTLGLTDYEGQRAAQEAANRNAAQGLALSKEQLEFTKEQYKKWNETVGYDGLFGDIVTYYKNLGADRRAAEQMAQVTKAEQLAESKIKAQMAQQGLEGSGLENALLANQTYNAELAKQQIWGNRQEDLMKQKLGVAGVGLGQGMGYLSAVGNASNTAVNSSMNWAGINQQLAANLGAENRSFMRGLVSNVGGYIMGNSGNGGNDLIKKIIGGII